MNDVTVSIGRAEDKNLYAITVALASEVKRGLKATVDVEPGKAKNSDHLQQLVFAAGGACAEYLDEKYGENHDPSKCGQAAVADFHRECRFMDELRVGFTQRLARAASLSVMLTPSEQRRVESLRFNIGRGASPTSADNEWINNLLRRCTRKERR